jgi:hypothetical protein
VRRAGAADEFPAPALNTDVEDGQAAVGGVLLFNSLNRVLDGEASILLGLGTTDAHVRAGARHTCQRYGQ